MAFGDGQNRFIKESRMFYLGHREEQEQFLSKEIVVSVITSDI